MVTSDSVMFFTIFLRPRSCAHCRCRTHATSNGIHDRLGREDRATRQREGCCPISRSRLAKFRSVQMPLHGRSSPPERRLVGKLVEACSVSWKASSGGKSIPKRLRSTSLSHGSKNPRDIQLRRYLWINASRFDLIDENKPFVGKEPMPPGRGFYPQGDSPGTNRSNIVKDHPEKKGRTL